MPEIEPAAVALKAPVVAPAATFTDAGTVSEVLLLASVTVEPPAGAAWVSVTVHVLTAPALNAAGEQLIGKSDDTTMVPLTPDVTLKPFPTGSTAIEFAI